MAGIVVTGAGGFVGRAVARRAGSFVALRLSGDDWRERVRAVDYGGACVIHLAARVHDPGFRGDSAYREDNAVKTEVLAQAAAEGGATVFVFASSIKVHGEESPGRPFRAADAPHPEDAYARSKWDAEQALRGVAERFPMSIHVVRPPLVYGIGAPGNLAAFLRLCDSLWPLPFASLHNRRSWIAVDDLADLLLCCARRPLPGMSTWLAAYPRPASTAQLAASFRLALRRPPRLLPCPAALLESAAAVAGRRDTMRRLTRSLEADPGDTGAALGWTPRIDLAAVTREMAQHRRKPVA